MSLRLSLLLAGALLGVFFFAPNAKAATITSPSGTTITKSSSGTISYSYAPSATVQCYQSYQGAPDSAIVNCKNPTASATSYSWSRAIGSNPSGADGGSSLCVRSNGGSFQCRTFWKDTQLPAAPIVSPSSSFSTTNPNVTFTFSPGADPSPSPGIDGVVCKVNGATVPCISPFSYTMSSAGSYTFSFQTKDRAGNLSTAATRTVSYAPPTCQSLGPYTGTYPNCVLNPPQNVSIDPTEPTKNSTAKLSFSLGSGDVGSAECRSYNAIISPTPNPSWNSCASPWTANLNAGDGFYWLQVRRKHNFLGATSYSSPVGKSIVKDTVPPTFTLDPTTSPTSEVKVRFSFRAFDGDSGLRSISCQAVSPASPIVENCTSPWEYTFSAPGTYTFRFRATDRAGNERVIDRSVVYEDPRLTVQNNTKGVENEENGRGTVKTRDRRIDCGDICSSTYSRGTVVVLDAVLGTDTAFEGWEIRDSSGNLLSDLCNSASQTCQLTINNSLTVTAKFYELFDDSTPWDSGNEGNLPSIPEPPDEWQEPELAPDLSAQGRYTVRQCTGDNPFFSGFATGRSADPSKSYRTLTNAYRILGTPRLGNFRLLGGYRPRFSSQNESLSLAQTNCSSDNRMGTFRMSSNDVVLWRNERNKTDVKLRKMLQVTRNNDYLRQNIRLPNGSFLERIEGRWSACRTVGERNRNALPQVWLQGGFLGERPFSAEGYPDSESRFPLDSAGNSLSDANYFTTETNCGNDSLGNFHWDVIDPCEEISELERWYKNCLRNYGGPARAGAAAVVYPIRSNLNSSIKPHAALVSNGKVTRFGLFCSPDPYAPNDPNSDAGDQRECHTRKNLKNQKTGQVNRTLFVNKMGQRAHVSGMKLKVIDRQKPRWDKNAVPGGATPVGGEVLPYPSGTQYRTFGEGDSRDIRWAASDQGGGLYSMMIQGDEPDLKPVEVPRMIEDPIISPPESSFAPPFWRVAVAPGTWLPTEGISYNYRWQFCRPDKTSNCKNLQWSRNHLAYEAWKEIERLAGAGWDQRGWVRAFVSGKNQAGVSEEVSSAWVRVAPRVSPGPHDEVGYGKIFQHIIGSPREGQTIALAGGNEDDTGGWWDAREDWWGKATLHRCPSRVESEGCSHNNGLPPAIHNFRNSDEYKLTRADVGSWLGYEAAPGNFSVVPNEYSSHLFPGIQQIDNLYFYGDNFGSPKNTLIESGGFPSARDWGILPQYALSQSSHICNSLDLLWTEEDMWNNNGSMPRRSHAARTNPCPAGAQSGTWNTEGEGLQNVWQEGFNSSLSVNIRDFCSRGYQRNCISNVSRTALDPVIVDTAPPSMSDPMDRKPGVDLIVPESGGQPGFRVEKGIRCKLADGDNDWHISDPECFVQVVDRYKSCAKPFEWNKFACPSSEATSLLRRINLQGDFLQGAPSEIQISTSDLRRTDFALGNLQDGRPEIELSASDRARNESEPVAYDNFVKIDREAPEALRITEGPGETEGGLPDKTNNKDNILSDSDCSLCWTVEGLETSSGLSDEEQSAVEADIKAGREPAYPWDYDHPAKLQCQLLYAPGRTPADALADWVDPPWKTSDSWQEQTAPKDTEDVVGTPMSGDLSGSTLRATTDWDCLEKDPYGDLTEEEETIAPFSMSGLPDGHYLFRVRSRDRAGHVGPWVGRPMIFDTTPPETGALSRARVYAIGDGAEGSEQNSATRQWQLDWGWDLLQRGESAGIYCFIRNVDSREIVRRSGWGCGGASSSGPIGSGWRSVIRVASLAESVETPMPWPGVDGEGRGTLAGLPDGNYEVGFLQRDQFGQTTDINQSDAIGFNKNGETIGSVAPPRIDLETSLDAQSVTSKRTEASLRLRSQADGSGNPIQLLPGQAFFPMGAWISHYTPQELYSYCQEMTENYSEYLPGSDSWEMEVREIGGAPSVTCPDGAPSGDNPTEIYWSGALPLDPLEEVSSTNPVQASEGSGVDPSRGTFTLNIFWMQPTEQSKEEAQILGGE